MSKYIDCCPPTCPNAKCRGTGSCVEDLPAVESPSAFCHSTRSQFCVALSPSARCPKCPTIVPVTFSIESLVADITPENLHPEIPVSPPLAPAAPRQRVIDTDSATRKTFPMAAGLLDYFPDALAEVSRVSYLGNQKHNPGEPMHHARGKSMDHADCIIRHLVGRGGFDGELRESAALAWRALALLQEELERELSLPLPRGAR